MKRDEQKAAPMTSGENSSFCTCCAVIRSPLAHHKNRLGQKAAVKRHTPVPQPAEAAAAAAVVVAAEVKMLRVGCDIGWG